MAGNVCFPGDESWDALTGDSSFDSSLSLVSCNCGLFRFLLSNVDVLIAEKKKQISANFDKVKSHSSRFSHIQFHALSISASLTRQTHLKATTEHSFSTLATISHSALSFFFFFFFFFFFNYLFFTARILTLLITKNYI